MKLLSAVIGGGAVVAMGVLGVASTGQSVPLAVHLPPPAPTAGTAEMNLGATITTTTPLPVEATTMARPVIKGPVALRSEEAALP